MNQEREGGFLPDLNPTYGPNQGLVAKDAKIRCFICQRITKEKYYGRKKAWEECGAWFHKKDSFTKWCWCPQCQFELNEPEEAMQMWPTKDPVFKTSRWREAKGLTEEKAEEFKRDKWMDPEGGPEAAEHLDVIVRRISQGPPPPPGLAPQSPPGSGGPPPAPE